MDSVELTGQQWKADVLHRIVCRRRLCGDAAHAYVHAIAQGRVLVDGVPVRVGGGLEDTARPAALG